MHVSLKAAMALLSALQLISSKPLTTPSPKLVLSEITRHIQHLTSGAQIPCNDTRVAQVSFMDEKLLEQERLCQAAMALSKVTKCKKVYEPLVSNLQSLQGKMSCSLSHENEIYLKNFLPELGNFTQAMYRQLGTSPTRGGRHRSAPSPQPRD